MLPLRPGDLVTAWRSRLLWSDTRYSHVVDELTRDTVGIVVATTKQLTLVLTVDGRLGWIDLESHCNVLG